jgi:hypothetical protein
MEEAFYQREVCVCSALTYGEGVPASMGAQGSRVMPPGVFVAAAEWWHTLRGDGGGRRSFSAVQQERR